METVDIETKDERILAVARLSLACVFLVAAVLDPSLQPEQGQSISLNALFGYSVYSVMVLCAVKWRCQPVRKISVAANGADIAAATVLTLMTGGPTSPFFVLFGFASLGAAYRWGLRAAIVTGLVCAFLYGVETLVMSTGRWPGHPASGFELNLFIVRFSYLILFAGVVGYLAEQEKQHKRQLADLATTAERARLARELHDSIVQSLLGIRMRLNALRLQSTDAHIASDLERSETLLAQEVTNLRAMMFELTSSPARAAGLSGAVRDVVDRFKHATAISVRLIDEEDMPSLPAHTVTELSRILQEALVNVYRHSAATDVRVLLKNARGACHLAVEDNGRGFDFTGRLSLDDLDRRGSGPRIIKERVRLLGGTLHIQSSPDAGARLEIDLPSAGIARRRGEK